MREGLGAAPAWAGPTQVAQPAGRLVLMCQASRVPWPLTHGCSQLRHAQVLLRSAEKGCDVIPELTPCDED